MTLGGKPQISHEVAFANPEKKQMTMTEVVSIALISFLEKILE